MIYNIFSKTFKIITTIILFIILSAQAFSSDYSKTWINASPSVVSVLPTWPGFEKPGFGAPAGTAPEGQGHYF